MTLKVEVKLAYTIKIDGIGYQNGVKLCRSY
jgi:hypothetical protein